MRCSCAYGQVNVTHNIHTSWCKPSPLLADFLVDQSTPYAVCEHAQGLLQYLQALTPHSFVFVSAWKCDHHSHEGALRVLPQCLEMQLQNTIKSTTSV